MHQPLRAGLTFKHAIVESDSANIFRGKIALMKPTRRDQYVVIRQPHANVAVRSRKPTLGMQSSTDFDY
jgi:hypothetical protein